MKVLHLISGGDTGGAKTHVFALLDALKHMADVKIACLMKGPFFDEIQEKGVKAVLFEQKSRLDLSVVDGICRLIREEGFEIVHAHGARANFIAERLKKKVRVPVITTVHSDYLLDFDGFYRKIVYTGLNVLALRKMDYYIAVSSSFRNMLISRNFPPNRIFTVYNGMDYSAPFSYMEKAAFAERIGIQYNPNHIYVGLIGRHDYVKGHDVFIKAAARAAKENLALRFVIAGDGEGREALVRLAEEEGVRDKLVFAGFIRDIYSFIHFIDINTLSSRSESFPYVLLEGARMKKPTISAAVGGIPDLIREGETGCLFPKEDDAVFAEKILYLAENKEKREALGEALYTLATENFSNESLARRHMEIYAAACRDFYGEKKYDVVLSGYYGFHNSGDDALLKAILESLREIKPDIRPLVLSATPKETREIYGVDSIHRFHIPALCRAFKKSRMLLNGGGSLLQDVTSSQSLWYYLWVMRLARKKGAKVFIYANGIGPLHGRNRLRAARAIRKAELVTLRDAASLAEIREMGLPTEHIRLTADPALALHGKPEAETVAFLEKLGIPKGKDILGISLLDWHGSDKAFCKKMAEAVDLAVDKYGFIPLFIPMKKQQDAKLCQKLGQEMRHKLYQVGDGETVDTVIGVVRHCTLLIGMRLHALIYAAGGGVPVIGLSYDPKVTGFMEYIGQNRILSIRTIDTKKVSAYIDEICENRDSIHNALSEKAESLRKKAEENAEICVNYLEKTEEKK